MKSRYYDDAFDERGMLKDGHKYRVPMTMRDSTKTHLHDGRGGAVGNRPGYAIASEPLNMSERQAAHDAYHDTLTNAWRGDAVGEAAPEGSACTVRNLQYPLDQGSAGHIRNGICVPDNPRSKADATDARRSRKTKLDPRGRLEGSEEIEEEETNDRRSVGQQMKDHENMMSEIYSQLDSELREKWRG